MIVEVLGGMAIIQDQHNGALRDFGVVYTENLPIAG